MVAMGSPHGFVELKRRQEVKKRILVIDDAPDIRDLLQTVLEQEGYEVITAPDGRSALKQIMRTEPDLILLDLFMPIMNGYEFIEQLRQRDQHNRSIPIMLLTAHKLSQQEFERLGVVSYLQKPFRQKELLKKISGLLSDWRRYSPNEWVPIDGEWRIPTCSQ
jgi:two-component system, sensor histidine kinase and response regulator